MAILCFFIPIFSLVSACFIGWKTSKKAGIKKGLLMHAATLLIVFSLSLFFVSIVFAAPGDPVDTSKTAAEGAADTEKEVNSLAPLAAALSTGLACIGGGIAVASGASAAIGAISESPEVFGKALIFVAMGEAIALYGVIISFFILFV